MQLIIEKRDGASISWLDEFLEIRNLCVIHEGDSVSDDFRGLILCAGDQGLSLRISNAQQTTPTQVDFLSSRLHHRVLTTRRKQGLPKAVGLDKSQQCLSVLDATAGLGTDAWSLAALGCDVHMLEQSNVMAALLADGIQRARESGSTEALEILSRLSLTHIDAFEYLAELKTLPDVIVLDPMFPVRNKSAKVKKDMALMQQFLPVNDNLDDLLALAIKKAGKRVVLKRPGKSEKDPLPRPDFQVPGKACHFQVFLTGG